jgi:hypothetical protein
LKAYESLASACSSAVVNKPCLNSAPTSAPQQIVLNSTPSYNFHRAPTATNIIATLGLQQLFPKNVAGNHEKLMT